jgi:hypothetical protein
MYIISHDEQQIGIYNSVRAQPPNRQKAKSQHSFIPFEDIKTI